MSRRRQKRDGLLHWLTFDRLIVSVLFIAVGSVACLMPAQNDTWWHLRTGQETWRTTRVQLHDDFSHTVRSAYWPNHEWLSQVLFYGLYHIGGLPLLTGIAAAFVTAAWLFIWRLTPGPPIGRLILLGFALMSSSTGWSLRPQLLTLFLIALTAFLIARRRYFFLPPVFLVWANLHGGVMLGFVLLMGAVVGAIFDARRLPVSIVVVAGLSVLVTALTPLGFSLWAAIPALLARLRDYQVVEWRPSSLAEIGLVPFWLMAAALVGLVLLEKPWRSGADRTNAILWAALGLLPLAVSSARNVPPFLLLAAPAIGSLVVSGRTTTWVPTLFVRARVVPRRERPALNAAILIVAAAFASTAVAYAWMFEIPGLGWHPLPQDAIAALSSCPERLYNRYDEGGYLIWFAPDRKVFMDSRGDPYPPKLVREQIRVETTGDYEALFNRYAIRCAFIPADSVVARRLATDGWERLYRGADWTVMARNR